MCKFLLYVTLFFIFSLPLFANEFECQKNSFAPVFSKSGNIYYIDANSRITQITRTGKDSSPTLSSNKKMIAFVRVGNQVVPDSCDIDTGTKYGNEIWLYDFSTKKEKVLVKNNFECDKPKKQIVDPSNLLFSPDDKMLYFVTTAWTTSGAIHGVQLDNGKQHFIAPANEIKIVSKGEYKGYLIAYQHRYFVGGGTYDWYWLISPEGKEEGPLGPEVTQNQINFIESSL